MHLLSLISFPVGYCRVSQKFVFDLSDFLLVEILLCLLLIILVKGIFELKISKLEFAMAKTSEATNYLEELVNVESFQKKECKYFNKFVKTPPKGPPKISSVTVTTKPDVLNTSELSEHSSSNLFKTHSIKSEIFKENTLKANVKIDEPDEKSSKVPTKASGDLSQGSANEQVQSNTLVRSRSSSKRSERRSRLPVPPKPKTPVDNPEAGDSTKMNTSRSAPTPSMNEIRRVNTAPIDFSATCVISPDLYPTYSLKFSSSKTSSLNQQIMRSSSNSNPTGSSDHPFGEVRNKTSSSASKILRSSPQSLGTSNVIREKFPLKALRGTSKHAVLEKSSRTSTSRCSSRGSST